MHFDLTDDSEDESDETTCICTRGPFLCFWLGVWGEPDDGLFCGVAGEDLDFAVILRADGIRGRIHDIRYGSIEKIVYMNSGL